ncbi:MAG: hypothetical protein WB440_21645 [Steroidobacteraceae bacterium]|jgi:hypothetical protein
MQGTTSARALALTAMMIAFIVSCGSTAVAAAAGAAAAPAPKPAPKAAAPATPKEAAQIDMTGHWVSIVTEDWIYRMLVARKGDIGSIPVNAAGKKATGNWDPAKDAAAGETCKAYGAAGIIRRPGRLNITWADDRTLRIDFDAGMKTRLLHFSEELPPTGYITSEPPVNFAVPNNIGAPSLEGYSVAAWHHQGQARGMGPMQEHYVPSHGGSLAAITGNLSPAYLQSNGVPYSSSTVLKEFFDLVEMPDGIQYLIVTSIVEDPVYLDQPWVTSTPFKREPDAKKWDPSGC